MSTKRADRASFLAEHYPAAREALAFCRDIASFQKKVDPSSPLEAHQALAALVIEKGPKRLRDEARALDSNACLQALRDYLEERDTTSPRSFFARVLLQPHLALKDWDDGAGGSPRCPRCGHSPQVGCLRPEGDGTALTLVCSSCLAEWSFPRGRCPACGEANESHIAYYSAPEIEHIQVQVCESCRSYFHRVDLSKDPAAVPDMDEVAALPLDIWAREKGFRKLHPNWVGI